MAFPIGEHNNKKERIGRMRHQVRFVSPHTSIDAVGGEVHTWVTGDSIWANVDYKQVDSDDRMIADRYTNITSALTTIRYNAEIEAQYRMIFDGLEWEIRSILPYSHNRYMQLEVVQYLGDSDSNDDGGLLIDDNDFPLIDDDGTFLSDDG